MNHRIGIVTGGGDRPRLHAVIRAVAKAAAKRGWQTAKPTLAASEPSSQSKTSNL